MDDQPSPEVPTWRGVRTFFPEMTIEVSAPAPAAVEALAQALRAERFRVTRSGAGLRARYVNWLDVATGTLNRTSLDLTCTSADGGTHVHVAATSTGEHRSGQRHASRALTAAIERLRAGGAEVTTTAWAVPEERRKGKRR